MSDKIADEKLLYCSFCGKSQHEVKKLIAGPSVFICDECIELCNDIIREELQEAEAANLTKSDLPVPREICQILDQYVIGQEPGVILCQIKLIRLPAKNCFIVPFVGRVSTK